MLDLGQLGRSRVRRFKMGNSIHLVVVDSEGVVCIGVVRHSRSAPVENGLSSVVD